MLKPSDRKLKITMINVLMTLLEQVGSPFHMIDILMTQSEKVDKMHKQMENFSRDTKLLEIIEWKC